MQLLAEIYYRRAGAAADDCLRVASGRGLADPAAPGYFDGALDGDAPLTLEREAFRSDDDFAAGATAARLGVANGDGRYDILIDADVGVYGRPARLATLPRVGAAYAAARPLLAGAIDGVSGDGDRLAVVWQDGAAALADKTAQFATYAANSAPPGGVEGFSGGDLKDKLKPALIGARLNIPAVLVNPSKHIYQVSAMTTAAAVSAVYDKGAALAAGVQRADVAALEAATPAALGWDWCRDAAKGLYFRLGSPPDGDVTADAAEGATAAARTPAQAWRRVMTALGGVADADIQSADLTALDAVASGECGVWAGLDKAVVKTLADEAAAAAGAVYFQRPDGRWRIRQVADPAGLSPAVRLVGGGAALAAGDVRLENLSRLSVGGGGEIPAQEVTLTFAPLGMVQNGGALVGSVTPERAQRLAAERLSASSGVDAAVAALHPNARRLSQPVCLTGRAAAEAEAARRRGLFGVRRGRWRGVVALADFLALDLDLIDVVRASHPRFFPMGKNFLLTRIYCDWGVGVAQLDLWG